MQIREKLSALVVAVAASLSVSEAGNGQPGGTRSAVSTYSPVSESILAVAGDCVGNKLWSGYGLSSGKMGCAAALSNVLKQAHLPYSGSAGVVVLRRQLLHGHRPVQETAVKHSADYGIDVARLKQVARPGDLIFGYMQLPYKPNLGADAHCGVVAPNGEVYANDWIDGVWKRDVADRFFAWYPHVYVMRILPPESTKSREAWMRR